MEKNICLVLLLILIVQNVKGDIQTGVIDLNKQLALFQTINQYTNVVCYTQLFARPFQSLPQISTSLTQFATESQENFHLNIKIRKIQLQPTKAKFIMYAKRFLTLWTKVSFVYLATDRSDFIASIATLQTTDLAGCGNIPEQTFTIQLHKNFTKPKAAAFISGFDVHSKKNQQDLNILQINIQITQEFKDKFTFSVKRISNIEIYEVSVGYVILNQKFEQSGYLLQALKFTEQIGQLQPQSPFIFLTPHEFNLNHAKFLYGFGKFTFQSRGKNIVKSLAIHIQQNQVRIGSFDSVNLKRLQFGFLVIKQSMKCQKDQITVRDKFTRILSCKKCQELKIPNKEADTCICMDGYKLIKDKCYQVPKQGRWSDKENTFICNTEYVLVKRAEKDQYRCQKPPKYMLLEADTNKWRCIDKYYQVNDQCLQIPENGFFNDTKKQIQCNPQYYRIGISCVKPQQNQQYSPQIKDFTCKQGCFRINKICLKPFPHSHFDQIQNQFACNDGYYLKKEGLCQRIPQFMIYNKQKNTIQCQNNYFDILDAGCQKKPSQFMQYNPISKLFQCIPEFHLSKGVCRKADENEQWNVALKQFVCIQGSFKIQQKCLKPKPNTRYSRIAEKFICIQGCYQINGQCLFPPINMKYSEIHKRFICNQGFHQFKIDQKTIECIKIPQKKKWSYEVNNFICLQGFYELKDGACSQPNQNQVYDQLNKQFICKESKVRIYGKCQNLPNNSIFDKQTKNFECNQGYFRKNQQSCDICRQDCLSCIDSISCNSCRIGFALNGESQKRCTQVCGDGIRFNDECDDGNINNGDGCSSMCKRQEGWSCTGGSPISRDSCQLKTKLAAYTSPLPKTAEIKLVGMSHNYGKIILNVNIFIPSQLLQDYQKLSAIFRVLTNSSIPLKISMMHINSSDNTFVIIYDFNNFEPIPMFITRIQLSPDIKQNYYKGIQTKSLFIKVNPAYMALRDKHEAL